VLRERREQIVSEPPPGSCCLCQPVSIDPLGLLGKFRTRLASFRDGVGASNTLPVTETPRAAP
jgi:hypothetical protein